MYGDDTWLKLFPETFTRADGTTSFFVSVSGICLALYKSGVESHVCIYQDFTEVDNNVTRHLSAELDESDWNGMFMHYLGLDHIGHKLGPRRYHVSESPYLPTPLRPG